ncbi:MAG: hypothetical protein V4492_02190 [Chlamydiota bacterium]
MSCSAILASNPLVGKSFTPVGACCAAWGHRAVGKMESIPVLSDIVALIKRLFQSLFSCCRPSEGRASQPLIASNGWGSIGVARGEGNASWLNNNYRDAVLYPTHAEEWNWQWNQTSPMHHVPGIRISDVDYFLSRSQKRPEVIILSQGRGHGGGLDNPGPGELKIEPGVEAHLRNQGFSEVYILKTAAAIEKYREMRVEGKPTLALIHTTC